MPGGMAERVAHARIDRIQVLQIILGAGFPNQSRSDEPLDCPKFAVELEQDPVACTEMIVNESQDVVEFRGSERRVKHCRVEILCIVKPAHPDIPLPRPFDLRPSALSDVRCG